MFNLFLPSQIRLDSHCHYQELLSLVLASCVDEPASEIKSCQPSLPNYCHISLTQEYRKWQNTALTIFRSKTFENCIWSKGNLVGCKRLLQSFNDLLTGHVINIPTMQFFTGISGNTQLKSSNIYHWLHVSGNFKILHYRILINMPYCKYNTNNHKLPVCLQGCNSKIQNNMIDKLGVIVGICIGFVVIQVSFWYHESIINLRAGLEIVHFLVFKVNNSLLY